MKDDITSFRTAQAYREKGYKNNGTLAIHDMLKRAEHYGILYQKGGREK